jgi:catechol 2,3-dioxygenase-like lactoylglutathione lyase family enzyme
VKNFLTLILLLAGHVAFASPFKLSGFTETVFIVADLEKSAKFYQDHAGWELKSSEPEDERLKTLWQLPKHAMITQKLMANKGENRGFIRLVHIDGVPQEMIRANTQSWDVGGIFDVNMRVTNMDKKSAELQALGWRGTSDPVFFTFGPFEVKEWLATGHDGVTLAMIERVKPKLEGWPNLKEMSRVFNATQVVSDIDKSLSF